MAPYAYCAEHVAADDEMSAGMHVDRVLNALAPEFRPSYPTNGEDETSMGPPTVELSDPGVDAFVNLSNPSAQVELCDPGVSVPAKLFNPTRPGGSVAEQCASMSGMAAVEATEPSASEDYASTCWELLGHIDYVRISQTCRKSLDIVCLSTPFVSKPPFLSKIGRTAGDSPVVVVSWEGDVLCMDSVVEYFDTFGGCIPEDWSELHGLNVVQLRFDSADAAASVCQQDLHFVANARGRKINVRTELATSSL